MQLRATFRSEGWADPRVSCSPIAISVPFARPLAGAGVAEQSLPLLLTFFTFLVWCIPLCICHNLLYMSVSSLAPTTTWEILKDKKGFSS